MFARAGGTAVTWTLDEVEGGTRLRVEQSGSRGHRVRVMFQADSRELYAAKHPSLLDATRTEEGPDLACWTPWGRFLRRLSTLFAE